MAVRYIGGGAAGTPVLKTSSRAGTHQFGSSYQTPAQLAGAANRGGGGGGVGFTGAAQVVGGDDEQAWQRQLWGVNYAAQQNKMNRDAAMGFLSPLSGSIAQLKSPVWGAGELGTARGLMEDRLSASRTSQARRLQDAAAQRGGTLGFSAQADLDRAHQQDLSEGIRSLQINAIEKNRASLENAIAKEMTLANMQTNVLQSFPMAPPIEYTNPSAQQDMVFPGNFANGTKSRMSGGFSSYTAR